MSDSQSVASSSLFLLIVIGLWLNIMAPSQATTPGQASAPFAIGLYSQNGLYTPSSPLAVQLSSSSSTGQFVANATESGITNHGYLMLPRVVVKNNHVTEPTLLNINWIPYGFTSGIENTGNLTVLDSTLANNSTTNTFDAGGIYSGSGSVLIINSTISGNSSVKSLVTGGIGIYGVLRQQATLEPSRRPLRKTRRMSIRA